MSTSETDPMGAYQPTPTSQSDPRWGGPCWKCGHPASYHGMTFCNAPANREKCDCDGYAPVNPQASDLEREVDLLREVLVFADGRYFGSGYCLADLYAADSDKQGVLQRAGCHPRTPDSDGSHAHG